MNQSIFVLGAIALLATASMLIKDMHSERINVDDEVMALWQNFKTTHNKKYGSAQEEMYRLQVFMNNLNYINENQGETYTLGINSLSDLTHEEFKATYLGYRPRTPQKEREAHSQKKNTQNVQGNPSSVNWVQAGVVPSILNQGQCGSCWAFSAAGAISMAYNVKNNNNQLQLSPEQLVQCSFSYGNEGCNGGQMNDAFRYAEKYPLCTLAQYPYTSGNGSSGNCNTGLQSEGQYGISSYTTIPEGNTSDLQTAIVQQPVSIAVDAEQWQNYHSGIFNQCGTNLDHGVIAVGYTPTYWLVRNSWGTGWGQQGYIELAPGNTCGLANDASYPNL